MGLTTEYERFVPGPIFGIIGNPSGNILLSTTPRQNHDLVFVGACENVIAWNLQSGEKEFELPGDKHAVTALMQNEKMTHLAVGYFDGSIGIFDLRTRCCQVMFSGHKKLVSCLAFDADGFMLASGGYDTEIVVWDIWEQDGVCRLKGHTDLVTQCLFLQQKNVLVSCSKDGLMKFWDLNTQHCFKTVLSDRYEIYDMLVLRENRILIANATGMIFAYNCSTDEDDQLSPMTKRLKGSERDVPDVSTHSYENYINCVLYGQFEVEGFKKRISFSADKNRRIFGYHTYRKNLNLFHVLNSEEIKKKMNRAKKKLEKLNKAEGRDAESVEVCESIDFEIDALKPLTFPYNIASFACYVKGDVAKLVLLFQNNSISSYSLNIRDHTEEIVPLKSIFRHGHRSIIKTLAFSSDSFTFLSASDECVKVWNKDSQNCFCTLDCDSALCSIFTAGNNHCLIGTKTGKIQIFEIGSCSLLENVEGHNGLVQCMCSYPDQRGLATGGSDKDVKFWELELVKDESYSSTRKRLTLSLQRTLKMKEEVLCVKFSPNNRMLAVSLLDLTVQVLYVDSLKLAFSLYGHALPVRCMDISHDSALIATGSDDRNVKLWSMEFGCCNKSIYAHEVAVSCVQFLPKSHLFFTAGKDDKIKQWDGDKFHKITTLEGHQKVIDALAVSPDGQTVISASRDRSIRFWEQTDQLLILEEEQEMEREADMDKAMMEGADPVIPGEYNKDVSLASKRTVEATKGVDQLIEAINVYTEETAKLDEHDKQCKLAKKDLPPIPLHPLFVAFSVNNPKLYVLAVLRRIKTSDLEETLLLLPFSYALQLFEIFTDSLKCKMETKFICRCATFLMKIHYAQLLGQHSVLSRMRTYMHKEMTNQISGEGFNLAGLRHLLRRIDSKEEPLFVDLTKRRTKKKKKILPVLKSV